MNTKNLPEWLAPHVKEVASWGAAPVARYCWVTGCSREAIMYGLCKTHYRRARRAWSPPPSEARYARKSPGVASAHDSVTASPQPSESTRRSGRGESAREQREVQGDTTECVS